MVDDITISVSDEASITDGTAAVPLDVRFASSGGLSGREIWHDLARLWHAGRI